MDPLKYQHLRQLLGPLEAGGRRIALGHALADAALGGGLRADGLHEVFAESGAAAAASGFALALARRALGPHKWLVWVRQDFSALEAGDIHAAGLLELGIDPARVLCVRAHEAKQVLRAGGEALACKGVGAVILEPWGEPAIFDLIASRRLTLAAQQGGTPAIVLRFAADPAPSTAETRWLVKSTHSNLDDEDWGGPRFDAALVRNRHGVTGRWTMQWDGNDGHFRAPHRGNLAAAPADRAAATALESLRAAG